MTQDHSRVGRGAGTLLLQQCEQDKGLLLRCFTQNIDTLERAAGVKAEVSERQHRPGDSILTLLRPATAS